MQVYQILTKNIRAYKRFNAKPHQKYGTLHPRRGNTAPSSHKHTKKNYHFGTETSNAK